MLDGPCYALRIREDRKHESRLGRCTAQDAVWPEVPFNEVRLVADGRHHRFRKCGDHIMPAAVTSRETARPEQPTNLISTPAPPASVTQQRPGSSANDPYLDQVNRMLGITGNHASEPIAHIEWSDSQQSNTTPRQRVFSDSNYTPVTSINTIRMPSPQPTQAPTPRRPQPYVTVVKETKLSCWPHKEGSAACRRYKARMHQIHRKNCDLRGNSQSISCQLA